MNRTGPRTQGLQPMQSNMFQNQQNPAARGAPVGSNRLQNGKLGNGSQWPLGAQMGPPPGLSSAQSRANGGGLSGFAQAIGNSQQPHTPLNLDDFPSLSTAPQAQQNSSAQQAWSNTNMRGGGGGPQLPHAIQRPQMQTPSQNQNAPSSSQHQQLQGQLHEDGSSATQGQFPSAGDDFRFGGQQGVGQLSGGAQAQTGSIDDFPPLGAGEGNVAPDRRLGMIQNAAGYGNSALTGTFPGLGHTRNGLSSPTDAQQDRAGPSAVGSRGMQSGEGAQNAYGMAREAMRIQDADRRPGQLGMSYGGSQLPPNAQGNASDGNYNPQRHKRLADMTDAERYSLPGLLVSLPVDSPDHAPLHHGQDLTVLGFDLDHPEIPLHPSFGSPFVDANVKPVIPPDWSLPPSYTVTNVPPLHTKMNAFSVETLLAIFYQYPRDIIQEMAASELYNRDWRWHIKLRQWMMKDPELPDPVQVSPKEEHGWYLFFDVNNWRRERRECNLNYDHLDQRHRPGSMVPPQT